MKRNYLMVAGALLATLPLLSSSISVIGVGRLGLCTALCMEQAGYDVLGVDVAEWYVRSLNDKSLDSPEPSVNEYLQRSKRFSATCQLDEAIAHSDMLFIVVPTPTINSPEAYDHKILNGVLSELNKRKIANKNIVICCTIFPGYIRNVANVLLADCENCTISYNPEFIAQGSIIKDYQHQDFVLIGEGSPEVGERIASIHRSICHNEPFVARMSTDSAEITKLALNCFITSKIAYANLIGDIAAATPGAEPEKILAAIGHDSRVGSKCLKPGYGFGGPCFPRDNRALGSYAESLGIVPHIMKATDQANADHATFMAEQLLSQNRDVYIFEDVNYKPNCSVIILEESQPLAVAQRVVSAGKKVIIRDRLAVIQQVKDLFGYQFTYQVTDQE